MPSVKEEIDRIAEESFIAGFKAGRRSSDPLQDFSVELSKYMANRDKYLSEKCYGCGGRR